MLYHFLRNVLVCVHYYMHLFNHTRLPNHCCSKSFLHVITNKDNDLLLPSLPWQSGSSCFPLSPDIVNTKPKAKENIVWPSEKEMNVFFVILRTTLYQVVLYKQHQVSLLQNIWTSHILNACMNFKLNVSNKPRESISSNIEQVNFYIADI